MVKVGRCERFGGGCHGYMFVDETISHPFVAALWEESPSVSLAVIKGVSVDWRMQEEVSSVQIAVSPGRRF